MGSEGQDAGNSIYASSSLAPVDVAQLATGSGTAAVTRGERERERERETETETEIETETQRLRELQY